MKLYIGSDFHIDFWDIHRLTAPLFDNLGIKEQDYDAFMLCGDIAQWDSKELYEKFIYDFTNTAKPVFVVAGNHEFYDSSYSSVRKEMKDSLKDISNLYILQDEFVDIKEYKVRVFGATLWTDFNKGDNVILNRAKSAMNDFRFTKGLTPKLALDEHYNSLEILKEAYFSKPDDYKFVVMTHHAPSLKACVFYHDMNFSGRDYTDYYFASGLEEWLSKNSIYPNLWAHGHTHISKEYDMCNDKIRVAVNSFGYKTKAMCEDTNYKAKVVEI